MTPPPAKPRQAPDVLTGSACTRRHGNAIADAATRIVVGKDWRRGIPELLGRLGQATGASRVTLFETHPGSNCRLVESCRYEWAEPGVAPLSADSRFQNMAVVDDRGEVDEWTSRRQRGEVVMATLRQVIGHDRQIFLEQGVMSFVSAPIMLRRGYWGFLGFDDCRNERAWSRHEIDMLGTASGLIAGAMEQAETDERLRASEERYALAERQCTSLTRYFSPNVVDEVLRAGGRILAVRSFDATVLFADLVDYTEMSSSLPGEQVLELLREFHKLVEDAVFGNQGTLDKYMGDGLMATFGTPRPTPRDATNAVACARDLIAAIRRWNDRRARIGLPRIRISIGLHFGQVTLGDVGTDRRFEFTAVGHTVNLASRIEAASRLLQREIIASEAVVAAVRREGGDAVLAGFENLGSHPIRGSKSPIELWGFAGPPSAAA